MGEFTDNIHAPGIEPEPPPAAEASGIGSAGVRDTETRTLKLNPLQARRAIRGLLRWGGNKWAAKVGDPRIRFTPEELENGADVWLDVVEAFWPNMILGPKAAALVGVGCWGYGTWEARREVIHEAAVKRAAARRKAAGQARGQAAGDEPPSDSPTEPPEGGALARQGDPDVDDEDGADDPAAVGSLE